MKTNALKTKTITCLFTFAILAFVSCTQNEELEMAAGRAIKFQNAAMTKGTANVSKGSFMVAGYRGTAGNKATATKVIDAVKYNVNGGFATPKYYDGVNSYWFYGYAQTGADTLAITGSETAYSESTPTIIFITPTEANVDLVTMASSEVTVANQGDNSQSVIFKHALSRVRYTAKKQFNDMNVTITSVILNVGNDVLTIPYGKFGAEAGQSSGTASSSEGTTHAYEIESEQELEDDEAILYTEQKLYVVPQAIQSIVVEYEQEGTERTSTFNPTTEMKAGKAYNFQFEITANSISFTTSLEFWNDSDDEDGNNADDETNVGLE